MNEKEIKYLLKVIKIGRLRDWALFQELGRLMLDADVRDDGDTKRILEEAGSSLIESAYCREEAGKKIKELLEHVSK